jgi:hypothetical protein
VEETRPNYFLKTASQLLGEDVIFKNKQGNFFRKEDVLGDF